MTQLTQNVGQNFSFVQLKVKTFGIAPCPNKSAPVSVGNAAPAQSHNMKLCFCSPYIMFFLFFVFVWSLFFSFSSGAESNYHDNVPATEKTVKIMDRTKVETENNN
jgi:hypothetical protein